ncbi:hypothetical protein TRVL_02256 [Trypanosoma vivax]|nr:hypothetical protein TRVL_02256 [Trypanosoma vivax]
MAKRSSDAVPRVGGLPKIAREEDANDGSTLKCPWRAKRSTARAVSEAHGAETPGEAVIERRRGGSGRTRQRRRGSAGGTAAEGICMPAVPSRPQEQGVAHQAQGRNNLVINSEGSNLVEQPVIVASPICSEE